MKSPRFEHLESETPLPNNRALLEIIQNRSEIERKRDAKRRKVHYNKIKERMAQERNYGNIWFEKDQWEFCRISLLLLINPKIGF